MEDQQDSSKKSQCLYTHHKINMTMFAPLAIRPVIVPLVAVVVGLILTIIYLLYSFGDWEDQTEKRYTKVRESQRQEDFECPRCGARVGSDVDKCPKCSAEFEPETYSCPVCGAIVSAEAEECPECEETFIVEEREFECPECGTAVNEYATECHECGASFWSPVRRSEEHLEAMEEKDKKVDPSIIEIVDYEEGD